MKTLLVFEYRRGKLAEANQELLGFAAAAGGECAGVLVGSEAGLPPFGGKLYLGDIAALGEFDPGRHAELVLQAVQKESPDLVVFLQSSYGWDLAPRVAGRLKAAQVSAVTGLSDGKFETACCNGKMRRLVKSSSKVTVLTLQEGSFPVSGTPSGNPAVEKLAPAGEAAGLEFAGYEEAEKKDVDLGKAEVIVSAGRGIGKKDNVPAIAALAKALNGEMGASRPVVDAGWVDHNRQVGATGQIVTPKLYVACAISGAIQHLTGMRNAEFIVAINTDKEAPISEVADVLVVADVMPFVAALTEKLGK